MCLVIAAIEEQSSSEYHPKEEQMRRHAEESRPDGSPEPNVRGAMVFMRDALISSYTTGCGS